MVTLLWDIRQEVHARLQCHGPTLTSGLSMALWMQLLWFLVRMAGCTSSGSSSIDDSTPAADSGPLCTRVSNNHAVQGQPVVQRVGTHPDRYVEWCAAADESCTSVSAMSSNSMQTPITDESALLMGVIAARQLRQSAVEYCIAAGNTCLAQSPPSLKPAQAGTTSCC
jgi:hypothetical protein